ASDFLVFNINPSAYTPFVSDPIQGETAPIEGCFDIAMRTDPCEQPGSCAGNYEYAWQYDPLDICVNCEHIEIEGYDTAPYNEVIKAVLNTIKDGEPYEDLENHIQVLLQL